MWVEVATVIHGECGVPNIEMANMSCGSCWVVESSGSSVIITECNLCVPSSG